MSAIVDAARGAVGVRFRLQGRDAATGLDCVGLVTLALAAAGCRRPVPSGYARRGGSAIAVGGWLTAAGLVRVGVAYAGDVIVFAPGACQLHLGISTGDGVIHADAALRRVVERPETAPWPVAGIWRWNGGRS